MDGNLIRVTGKSGNRGDELQDTAKVLCAIHQPNFFPWLGFFDKIRRADIFVFLDDVAYPRAGSGGMGSWTNRVKVNIQGEPRWFGCPVKKYHGTKRIREVSIADDGRWRGRLMQTLDANYARSPGYEAAMALLGPLISNPTDNLAEYNISAIVAIADALGLRCRFVRQSEIGTAQASTMLLVEIVRKVGAGAYLAGGGAAGYQEDDVFGANQLELTYQRFEPRVYGAEDRFIPGLSVIDFLMQATDWQDFPEQNNA